MGYLLTNNRLRVVRKNAKGVVTYRKRYKKGDRVDVSKLVDGRLDQLLASGTLVDEDDTAEHDTQLDPIGGDERQGDGTEGSDDADEPEGGTDEPVGTGDFISDTSTPDVYSNMEYADLQKEAKGRGLNAGGSADDLRTRLRGDDHEAMTEDKDSDDAEDDADEE